MCCGIKKKSEFLNTLKNQTEKHILSHSYFQRQPEREKERGGGEII